MSKKGQNPTIHGIHQSDYQPTEEVAEFDPKGSSELHQVADSLRTLRSISPSPEFRDFSPGKLTKVLPEQPVTNLEVVRLNLRNTLQNLKRRPVMTQVIMSVILFFSLSLGGYAAVDAAGPGDALYGLDTAIEQLQLAAARKPESVMHLNLAHAVERLKEAEKALSKDDLNSALEAFQAYEREMVQVRALVANSISAEQVRVQARFNAALEVHQQIMNRIMENASIQTQNALQKTIQNMLYVGDQPQEPPEDAPKGPAEDAPQAPPEEAPQSPPEDAPQSPPEDAPQAPPEDAPQAPPEDAPQGPSEEAPQGPTEDAPQGPSENGPKPPSGDSTNGPQE